MSARPAVSIPPDIEAYLVGKPSGSHSHQGAKPGALPTAGTLTTRNVSDITAQPIRWMWRGRIARGKLTIIAGNPGLGKSQITASIAAIVTTGGLWPVDRERCEPGDVVFLSAEDDPADTLRPRLEAAGADLSKVHVIDGVVAGYSGDGDKRERSFCLQEDIHALGRKLADLGNVGVVILDPITAYLGTADSHKNAEVRGLLTPLSELASRYNVAVLGVSHLTKAAGTQALMWSCPHFWHKKLRLKNHRMENLSHGAIAPEVHERVQDCRATAVRCGRFDRSSRAGV